MISSRAWGTAGGIALAGFYLVRAIIGAPGAHGFGQAWADARQGRLDRALPPAERAETGASRFEAAWLQGEIRLGLWDRLPRESRDEAAARALLSRAASDYLRAAEAVPAAAWPRAGLAGVYARREAVARARRAYDLGQIDGNPWSRVGEDGRVAVGLLRMASRSEPTNFTVRDQAVTTLLELGLEADARQAVREAAHAQPVFALHESLDREDFPRSLLEAFAEGAREALGHAPMLSLERHRLTLGLLERRLGRLDRAVADLRAAHAERAEAIRRAETAFYLGLALGDAGDAPAARVALDEAAAHPVFRGAAYEARSRVEERDGKPDAALAWAERALGLDPSSPDRALRFGALARRQGKSPRAEKAYRRAVAAHPDDARLWAELVQTLLELEDPASAARTLDEMKRRTGESDATARLEEAIARAYAAREGR